MSALDCSEKVFDPEKTVAELKVVVQAAAPGPEFAAERQKLILAGKILEDASTLSSCGIAPKAFIVCMLVSKNPSPPARHFEMMSLEFVASAASLAELRSERRAAAS